MKVLSIDPSVITAEDNFAEEITTRGWVHFRQVIDKPFVDYLNEGLAVAYNLCRSIQIKNGIGGNMNGTVHHLPGQHDSFLEFIQRMYLDKFIKRFFGAPYILNGFGGVSNLPSSRSYVSNIHRDIRTFYNVPMMLNMLVMLDDFTEDNGATWFLTGSNNFDEKPDEKYFYENADRALGKAGDIILFDSLLWHAAGMNTTDKVRRALTLTYSRPFMKQQLDYPRLFGYDNGEAFAPEVRQVIGYNSRVPSTLDEWYQPVEKRFYKQGQG